MIRTQVYIPEGLHKELKLLANAEQTNVSMLIREGVLLRLKKKPRMTKPRWKNFVGALKYGPKDLSNHINDIYK